MLAYLASIIYAESLQIKFKILEIGAVQLEGSLEPFYLLLDLFSGFEIIGFEIDKDLCDAMNSEAVAGLPVLPKCARRKK
jgi:hypothetical protein